MSLTQDHKSGWMDILPTNLQEEKGDCARCQLEKNPGAVCARGETTEEDERDRYFTAVSPEELV